MLTDVAKFVSVFMCVPVCVLCVICLLVGSHKVKLGLIITQIVLVAIQLAALIYRIAV